MDGTLLVAFIAAVILITVVPGPDLLYILAQGAAAGPRAGATAAFGMGTGMAVHTVAAALGLSAILQVTPYAMDVIRVAGVAFLIYLAIKTFRAPVALPADSTEPSDDAPTKTAATRKSLRRVYVMGMLTNIANPKIILFYLAFLPQFVAPSAGWPVPVQLLVLGGVFIAVGLIIDVSAGIGAGALSGLLRRRVGFQRWMNRISATVFGALAVRLALDSSTR